MGWKNDFKYLVRSRSWRFMRDARAPADCAALAEIRWRGAPIAYRPGTSDTHVIYKILLRTGSGAEYRFPGDVRPRVIWDVGANIGAATLLLARTYPQAAIYAFEPFPENSRLLIRNTAGLPNVHVLGHGLGGADGERELIFSPDSANFGGFSFFQRGAAKDAPRVRVPVRSPASALAELGLDALDLIKIDTEGAEGEILRALPRDVLARVQWIAGELHGENDFELLEYLSAWFDLGVRKNIGSSLTSFEGRNRVRQA